MDHGRLEVMRYAEPFLEAEMPKLLREPEKSWQPSDFMPDLSTEEGFDEVRTLQAEAKRLGEDTLVALVGDMITEEALPTYASWIFPLEGVETQGEPRTVWGHWNRGWCAEENRHGDLLNRYLYLSGRVNMREIELTIHNLITDGGDTQTMNDPYRTFIYTSFQEIATRISHLNVGQKAREAGAGQLFDICKRISGDENRHARAYKSFIQKFIEVDASEVVLAFEDMMKKKITMPAMYMRERGEALGDTFAKFERVATRSGIYTPTDYVGIIEDLLSSWDIEHLTNLTPSAQKAQDYLCNLPARYRKIIERFRVKDIPPDTRFSWLNLDAKSTFVAEV
jgi:acyl-[acyl-carrier-protein] desaturase